MNLIDANGVMRYMPLEDALEVLSQASNDVLEPDVMLIDIMVWNHTK